jgi:hypothetical protein
VESLLTNKNKESMHLSSSSVGQVDRNISSPTWWVSPSIASDGTFYFNGDNRFFTGWLAFELGDLAAFRVGYADYAYVNFDQAATFGFTLSKGGAGASSPPSGGLSTGAIAPLILDQWFDEKVLYNSATGIMTYFVNGSQLGQMNVGKPTATTGTVSLQLWFQAYGWWYTHYQHFDDLVVRLVP